MNKLLEHQEHSLKAFEFCEDNYFNGFKRYVEKNNLKEAITINLDCAYLRLHQFVGVISYKGHNFQILPKLTTKENEERILKNLIFMLSYTKKLDIKTAEAFNISKSKNPFLEILIREYAISLFEALKRLTPRNYIREENNLNFIKGKLKFNENIKYNCANQAKFYCEYDEYSEDNILNRLFLFVSDCLYKISSDNKNKATLKTIIDYFSEIKPVKFNKEQTEKIKLSRNREIFKKPFNLAKLFVENSSVDLSLNKIENITFLFDMNKLFEEFIFEILNKTEEKDFKVYAQKKCKLLSDENNYLKRDTYVDILIEAENKKIVLDTKYKEIKSTDDVQTSDIYQVSTYCLLHKAHNAILLYPKFNVDINKSYYLNCPIYNNGEYEDKKTEYKISILTVDIADIKFDKSTVLKFKEKLIENINNLAK